MSKRLKLTLFVLIVIILIITIFIKATTKDDMIAIADEINEEGIIHIEHLNKKNAIAFYVSVADNSVFGHALVKKNIFGWKFLGGSSTDYTGFPPDIKLGWSFSNLEHEKGIDYTDLIYGKVIDDDIKKIKVTTEEGKEYSAEIISEGGGGIFWYLFSENKDLATAKAIGLSETDEIIFEYPEE